MRKIYYNKPAEWLELSVDNTLQANLRIDTISGLPYFVDWGDGVVETYTNLQTVTKVYSSNFTGIVRIATPMGLGDVGRVEINDNLSAYNFDATALSGCVNMTYLYLQGGGFTGDMSGVSAFTSLTYLWVESGGFTGNMSGVTLLLNLENIRISGGNMTGHISGSGIFPNCSYIVFIGDFTADYTSRIWANGFRYYIFRPTTSTNPLSSTEIDQMLIDASQATWAGAKALYADGNNGIRTSASDAAVLTLQGMGVTLYLNV